MASSVDEKVASFDSVSDEALKCLEKASSMALTVATLTDCRLECAKEISTSIYVSRGGFCKAISFVDNEK